MHINTRMLCPLIFKFFWQYIQKVIHTLSTCLTRFIWHNLVVHEADNCCIDSLKLVQDALEVYT